MLAGCEFVRKNPENRTSWLINEKNSRSLLLHGRSHQPVRRFWGTPSPFDGSIVNENRVMARVENFSSDKRDLQRQILGFA
jgi:hypothetical protein